MCFEYQGNANTRGDIYGLDPLTQGLVTSNWQPIYRLFEARGISPPTLAWSPDSDSLYPAPLQIVAKYWERLGADRRMPHLSEIDPCDIRGALGWILLMDVDATRTVFTHRLYGSRIAAYVGRDVTGEVLEPGVSHRVHTGEFFLASYKAVIVTEQPLFSRHFTMDNPEVETWSRYVAPLLGDSGAVERLIVAHVPTVVSGLNRWI